MTKKKIQTIVVAVVLAVLLVTGGILLYLYMTGEHYAKAENTYEPDYHSYCLAKEDPDIVIDGVLDEKAWENLHWFTHTFVANSSGTMPVYKVTAFPTEYGVYVASVAEDANLTYNGCLANSVNTNWSLSFAAWNAGDTNKAGVQYTKAINVDLGQNIMSAYTNVDRAVVVDGILNSGDTKSATLEMFIPWSVLEIDTTKGIPECVGILPKYCAVLDGDSSVTTTDTTLIDANCTKDYYMFDKNGYTAEDAKDAVLGDTKYGYAKTASWDVSNESEGVVRSNVGTEYHRIYFKEAYGSDYIVETTIVPCGTINNDYAKAGIFFMASTGDYHAVFLNIGKDDDLVSSVNGTKNFKDYSLTRLNNEGNFWNWNQDMVGGYDVTNNNATRQEGVKLTVIKYGEQFWYFADGKYLATETWSFMDREVSPGFYALGADVIYKEYSCEKINESKLQEYLNSKGLYYVETSVKGGGGTAVSSTKSVAKGGSYTLSLNCKSGYEVTSVLINDVEKINDIKKNAVDGTYTVSNVNENQHVVVTYGKCDGVTFSGIVKNAEENIAATIVLCHTTNKALRYEVEATTAKGFKVKLPEGTYKLHIEATNHESVDTTIKLSKDTEKDYTLKVSVFAESLKLNGKTVNSSKSVWDMTQEYKGVVSTSYSKNPKEQPLYFATTGTNFVLETTIDYTTVFKNGVDYQTDLMGGFCFTDGSSTGWIVAHLDGIVYTNWIYKDNLHGQTLLSYPDKRTAKLSVAKYGDNFYVYIDGVLVQTMKWSQISGGISSDAEMAFGLWTIIDKTADIAFSKYNVQVSDSAVKSYIKKHALKAETISQNAMFSKTVSVNGKFLTSATQSWDLSSIASGVISGSYAMGTRGVPMYFTQTGNAMMVEATIDYSTVFKKGVEYQPDLFGGFVFSDGTNSGWVAVNNDGIVHNWNFYMELTSERYLTASEKRSAKLTIVLKKNYFYMYINDTLVARRQTSDVISGVQDNAQLAVGLWMWADKNADIRYSNMSITTDANAIQTYISRDSGTKKESSATLSNMRLHYNREYYIAQGAETDGTYFYMVMTNGGNEKGIIVKRRVDNFEFVSQSDPIPLGHGNDICYNPQDHILVVTNMNSVAGEDGIRRTTLTIVNPDTLQVEKQVTLALDKTMYNTVSKIAYSSKRQTYVLYANTTMYICNRNFEVLYSFAGAENSNYTGQGMGADDTYFFTVQSPNSSKGANDNIINVYSWDTGYVGTVHVNMGIESEGLLYYKGKYYMIFNHEGSAIMDLDLKLNF